MLPSKIEFLTSQNVPMLEPFPTITLPLILVKHLILASSKIIQGPSILTKSSKVALLEIHILLSRFI